MNLFLEVKNGELAGQKFKVEEGLRIGRTIGEILLKDSKISSLHAQIEKNRDGEFVLVDRDSSNGLWIGVNKVKTVAMMRGVTFRLGKTLFSVVEELPVPATQTKPASKDRRSEWVSTLSEAVRTFVGEDTPSPSAVYAFNQVMELRFIAGPQLDEVVTLGYGPRKFGSSVMDIDLKDRLAPFLAFQILVHNRNPVFETSELKVVQVNYQTVQSCPLQEGDIISLGDTAIRVSFLK